MRVRETPLRVNKDTTALDLLEYLRDLEEVLSRSGRVVAIPEQALIQIKSEFFWAVELLRDLSHFQGSGDQPTFRITQEEWRKLFAFINKVGQTLSHFEEVGGEIPIVEPPESEP
jgi:hypothetical protein